MTPILDVTLRSFIKRAAELMIDYVVNRLHLCTDLACKSTSESAYNAKLAADSSFAACRSLLGQQKVEPSREVNFKTWGSREAFTD
jgi:hypothetical protein